MFGLKLIRKYYRALWATFIGGGLYNMGILEGQTHVITPQSSYFYSILAHLNYYLNEMLRIITDIPVICHDFLNWNLGMLKLIVYGIAIVICLGLVYIVFIIFTYIFSLIDRTFLGKYDLNVCLKCNGNLKEIENLHTELTKQNIEIVKLQSMITRKDNQIKQLETKVKTNKNLSSLLTNSPKQPSAALPPRKK